MFKLGNKSDKQVVEITVSNRTVVRVLLAVVLTMLGLAVLKTAQHALVLIFTAFFLALAFNPPVSWIASRLPGKSRGSRSLATAVSALLILVVLGTFLASIVPPIVRQTGTLIDNAPQLINDVQNENSTIGRFINRYNLDGQVDQFSDELSERLKNATGSAVSTISSVGSSIFSTLTVLALTFMMIIEGPHWIAWFKRLTPKDKRDDVDLLTKRMYKVIKGYVNGQVTLAAIAAILILPMVLILGISYPFALLFIIFICGLIPMVGHTIGAIIVTLVALFQSPAAAIIILSYYILYQQIENYVVQPRIQANSTEMSPLLVFASVVVGVSFGGLLGGLVAIPVAGCLRVVALYYLEHRDKDPIPARLAPDRGDI
jgi:predicted PurR-regulated permease PerM